MLKIIGVLLTLLLTLGLSKTYASTDTTATTTAAMQPTTTTPAQPTATGDAKAQQPAPKQASLSHFESTMLQAQKSKDFSAAYNEFVNTEFLVLVDADKNARQGETVKDVRFTVVTAPNKPNDPVVIIAQEMDLLYGIQKDRVTAIKLSGGELVMAVHPKISLAIAMSSGIFEMDSTLVQALKQNLKKAANQTPASPAK